MNSTPPPVKGLDPSFDLVPTPNPQEFSLRVSLDATMFKPDTMVPPGTPYKECRFLSKRGRMQFQGFEDYVYTYCSQDGGNLWFYFGKRRTEENRDVPFRSFYTYEDYPWPAVLEDIYIVQSSFPQTAYNGTTTITAPSYFARYRYRPAVSVDSMCLVEQFLDAVPWREEEMYHDQPIPGDVNATYLGLDINFPRCLHKDVRFVETVPGAQVVVGAGMVSPPAGRNTDVSFFPKTNFVNWATFVLKDQQQPTGGMFLRERVTIYPPAQQRAIIR